MRRGASGISIVSCKTAPTSLQVSSARLSLIAAWMFCSDDDHRQEHQPEELRAGPGDDDREVVSSLLAEGRLMRPTLALNLADPGLPRTRRSFVLVGLTSPSRTAPGARNDVVATSGMAGH